MLFFIAQNFRRTFSFDVFVNAYIANVRIKINKSQKCSLYTNSFLIIVNFLILKRTQMYKNLLNCNCKRTITLQITKNVHIGEEYASSCSCYGIN